MNDVISTENSNALFERVVSILEQARSNVVRTVPSQIVISNSRKGWRRRGDSYGWESESDAF